jgi:sec-independent protein translocase protein TatA
MFGLGVQELVVIAILAVILLFGVTRLPNLGRSIGQSIRGFKKGLQEDVPDPDEAKPGKVDAAQPATPDKADKPGEVDPPAS